MTLAVRRITPLCRCAARPHPRRIRPRKGCVCDHSPEPYHRACMGPGVVMPVRLPSWFPTPGTLICGRATAGLTPSWIADTHARVTVVKGTQAPFISGRDGRFDKDRVSGRAHPCVDMMSYQWRPHDIPIISSLFPIGWGNFRLVRENIPSCISTLAR
jgi:hypothetical protein